MERGYSHCGVAPYPLAGTDIGPAIKLWGSGEKKPLRGEALLCLNLPIADSA
jgi:hypothetical protein